MEKFELVRLVEEEESLFWYSASESEIPNDLFAWVLCT